MPNFTAFLSYVIISTFTPGPNNIMAMSNASRYGFRKSLRFNIGVFLGFFIIMILSSIFSVALYKIIPSIKPVMTFIGAAYILYLAWKTYKSEPHDDDESSKSTNSILSAILLQFVNTKVILYCITAISTFIIPYYKSVFVLILFSIALAFTGFVSTCCWALFGAVFQRFIVKNDKAINITMALLLLYCAISLFL